MNNMYTAEDTLTYCTNIHPGNDWEETFFHLKENLPQVKSLLNVPEMAVGLRMGRQPLTELLQADRLAHFKEWLLHNGLFVNCINGFPFGNFHRDAVKDAVHLPDWTSGERVAYTMGLIQVLAELLPDRMEGGISTSPVTYRPWHKQEALDGVCRIAARNMAEVLLELCHVHRKTGRVIHLDVEPEPDGLIEDAQGMVRFYHDCLMPAAVPYLSQSLSISEEAARQAVERHFAVCFDICHFAVVFEDVKEAIDLLLDGGIRIGRIQVSAALEARTPQGFRRMLALDEPVYLHQLAVQSAGQIHRYPDLHGVSHSFAGGEVARTHFHVPVFAERFRELFTTRQEIVRTLNYWKEKKFTDLLEVETYTFDILPEDLKMELTESIAREMKWVKKHIKK